MPKKQLVLPMARGRGRPALTLLRYAGRGCASPPLAAPGLHKGNRHYACRAHVASALKFPNDRIAAHVNIFRSGCEDFWMSGRQTSVGCKICNTLKISPPLKLTRAQHKARAFLCVNA